MRRPPPVSSSCPSVASGGVPEVTPSFTAPPTTKWCPPQSWVGKLKALDQDGTAPFVVELTPSFNPGRAVGADLVGDRLATGHEEPGAGDIAMM